MQDDRHPAVTNWIKAEKRYDPELAKLLEGKVTSLFIGEKKEEDREVLRLPINRSSR